MGVATSDAEAVGKYSHLGRATSTGDFKVDFTSLDSNGCIKTLDSPDQVTTAANGDTVVFKYEDMGKQCFLNGDSSVPTDLTSFCSDVSGAADDEIATSTVDVEYVITSGTGRFDNVSGGGDVHSVVNHCDDTFTGHLLGTIEYNASDRSG